MTNKKFVKIKTILRLLTWQTSLIIISIGFLILTGVVTITSSKTREVIQESAIGMVSAALSSNVEVKLVGNIESADIFFYDLINGNGKNSLKLEQINNKYNVFKLPPGKYRIVVLKEGYEQFEKEIVISTDGKKITVKIDLKIPENVENESVAVVNDLIKENQIYDSRVDVVEINNNQMDFELKSVKITNQKGNYHEGTSIYKGFNLDDTLIARFEFDEVGQLSEGIKYKYEIIVDGEVRNFGSTYYNGNKIHSSHIPLKSNGLYEVAVWVDPEGKYKETNENNNHGSIKFIIGENEGVSVTTPIPTATKIPEPIVTIIPTSTPIPTATLIPTPVPTIMLTATTIPTSEVRLSRVEIIDSNGNIVTASSMSPGMYTYKVYLIGYDQNKFTNVRVYGAFDPIPQDGEFPGYPTVGYLVRESSISTSAIYKGSQFSFSTSKGMIEVWADADNYDPNADSQAKHSIVYMTKK